MSDKVVLSVATLLADSYLLSAIRMCLASEGDATENDLVHGGIFLLAAFIEGKPRELVYDLMDSRTDYFDQAFKNKFEAEKGTKKKHPFEGLSPVDKYGSLVAMKQKATSRNLVSQQEVCEFVKVRNKLVHYDPQWVTSSLRPGDTQVDQKSQFAHLDGRFPLWEGGALNSFFPDKLVSRGFLAWAIFHTCRFIESFLTTCQMETYGRKLAVLLPPLFSQLEQLYSFDPVSGNLTLS